MSETWVDIKGFEGYYQVSNLGNVKSLDRYVEYSNGRVAFHKGKLLIPKENHGYLRVSLSKNGKWKEYRVHRLVAETFIDNPDNKPYVNHIDEDKRNNYIENLEWVTSLENLNHSRKKYEEGMKKKNKKVKVVKNTGEILMFDSVKECLEVTGITDGSLCRINGKVVQRGKFKGWCFKIEETN